MWVLTVCVISIKCFTYSSHCNLLSQLNKSNFSITGVLSILTWYYRVIIAQSRFTMLPIFTYGLKIAKKRISTIVFFLYMIQTLYYILIRQYLGIMVGGLTVFGNHALMLTRSRKAHSTLNSSVSSDFLLFGFFGDKNGQEIFLRFRLDMKRS